MKKILLTLLLLATVPVFAQYAIKTVESDVRSILAAPDDGQRVLLRGEITGKIDDEEYMFTDGTGNIRLDIDDDLLWGQVLTQGTRVEIEGKVDKHLFGDAVDIDVERVLVLKGTAGAGGKPSNG
jgi:uncharacterized protein (TIGR00156 family)